jgi:tetratricopeptide (TPR) repeat protein
MKKPQRAITKVNAVIALSAITLSSFSINAFAQSADADFAPLIKSRNTAGVETLARERLAKNSKDDVALWYLGRAVASNEKKRDELIPRVEQCIKDLPQSARCHNVLGSMYGVLASSGGMTAGMKYAGKIKDMFLKAVELDPKNFDMRRDLNQYYLIAPGIVGGSVKKAIENSNDFAKIDPARGQLLRAEAHIYEKEFAKAETLLRSIKATDADLAEDVTSAINSVGFGMINTNEPALAQKLFERQIALDAKNANAHFGLGRALLEQKNVDGAIASMERALQIEPKTTAHYRLGIAYQTKGDKAKATAAFQQFLSYQKTGKAVEDASKRLEELKKG